MILKDIRLKAKYTQKCVAELSGITESFYCLIEKGYRRPSPETAKRIAIVLGFENYGYDWTKFYDTINHDKASSV